MFGGITECLRDDIERGDLDPIRQLSIDSNVQLDGHSRAAGQKPEGRGKASA